VAWRLRSNPLWPAHASRWTIVRPHVHPNGGEPRASALADPRRTPIQTEKLWPLNTGALWMIREIRKASDGRIRRQQGCQMAASVAAPLLPKAPPLPRRGAARGLKDKLPRSTHRSYSFLEREPPRSAAATHRRPAAPLLADQIMKSEHPANVASRRSAANMP